MRVPLHPETRLNSRQSLEYAFDKWQKATLHEQLAIIKRVVYDTMYYEDCYNIVQTGFTD